MIERFSRAPQGPSAAGSEAEEDGLGPALSALSRCVERAVSPGGSKAHLGPIRAFRATRPTRPEHAVFGPLLCVVAQGSKQVLLGDDCYTYKPGNFLLNSVTVPAAGQVLEASEARPCLWLTIEIDLAIVISVASEAGLPRCAPARPLRAMEASPITLPLLQAVLRLARLFDTPDDAGYLAPLALREIVYRLLTGDQVARLGQLASRAGETCRIVGAVEWLRSNFDQPMSVEALARERGMSPSAFHHHFKRLTAMSPLQFQKQLRLQEAKRLMVSEGLDAASAGFRVGYEDASHFSREYRRFFGAPPKRHISRVRDDVA